MKVILLWVTPDAEKICETAMLSCRNLFKDLPFEDLTFDGRLKTIYQHGHFGIFEHASASFMIGDISRVFTHQHVRHRIGISHAQISMRAVELNKLGTIIPPRIAASPEALDIYLDGWKNIRRVYDELRVKGIPVEDARFIAGAGVDSQVMPTATFRAWIHYLEERLYRGAQWEIRAVAEEIWKRLQEQAPNIFDPKWKEYWE